MLWIHFSYFSQHCWPHTTFPSQSDILRRIPSQVCELLDKGHMPSGTFAFLLVGEADPSLASLSLLGKFQTSRLLITHSAHQVQRGRDIGKLKEPPKELMKELFVGTCILLRKHEFAD